MRMLALLSTLALAAACQPGTPVMDPGSDCMSCHRAGGVAEDLPWTLAGTVFATPTSREDQGIAGVEIHAVGADGRVTVLNSNSAGNFYTREKIAFPASIEVHRGGQIRRMGAKLEGPVGCASCHDATPRGGAPGRLFLEPEATGTALCRACSRDADCEGGSCTLQPGGARACATRCTPSKPSSCPPGYQCAELVDSSGRSVADGCVPVGGAPCPSTETVR